MFICQLAHTLGAPLWPCFGGLTLTRLEYGSENMSKWVTLRRFGSTHTTRVEQGGYNLAIAPQNRIGI